MCLPASIPSLFRRPSVPAVQLPYPTFVLRFPERSRVTLLYRIPVSNRIVTLVYAPGATVTVWSVARGKGLPDCGWSV